ncbi:MAG: phosphotransferase [Acidimicrobiia bacterium]|nr:phosphotransferase [Acidimicrobiia bacterium]
MGPEDVHAALTASFEELATEPVLAMDQGWSFSTWQVGPNVWRFPLTSSDAALLEREIELLPKLVALLPVAVSSPQWVGTWAGLPFAGYPKLPGVAMTPIDLRSQRIVEDIAAFLDALHGVPVEIARKALTDGDRDSWGGWLSGIAERVRTYAANWLDPTVVDELERRMAAAERSFEFEPTLVHGDLGFDRHLEILDHLLVEDARLSGAIDFSDMHIGDPAIDFAGILDAGGTNAVTAVMAASQRSFEPNIEQRVGHHYLMVPVFDLLYAIDTQDEALAEENAGEIRRRILAIEIIE